MNPVGKIITLDDERWVIVHRDFRRDMYTLERARRWFKGRLLVLGGEDIYRAGAAL